VSRSSAADERVLAALQQQRDHEVFFVVEVAHKVAAEIEVALVEASEVGAERLGVLGNQDRSRAR
jgi:hypothetical protein